MEPQAALTLEHDSEPVLLTSLFGNRDMLAQGGKGQLKAYGLI